MKKTLSARFIGVLVLTLPLLLFWQWYGGNAPLTRADVNRFLNQVDLFETNRKHFITQIDLKEFLYADDGKAFYVVNLFKFKPDEGSTHFANFSSAVIPLWLRYGSHPVFASTEFLGKDKSWDRITIVRYRSRRDWIEIMNSDAFIQALPSRFAATENNDRYTVSGILLPNPILALGLFFLMIAFLIFAIRKALSFMLSRK